ncbi:MAG TPA: c-type cytochrome [Gemmatimonadales bacterium]|nr:c-type cytochrome [Gemmatimonadales bacterium]
MTAPGRGARAAVLVAMAGGIAALGCRNNESRRGESGAGGTQVATAPARDCAPDNGGLTLPEGFCATVFADSLGHARHLAVAPNGVVYVNTWSGKYYGNEKPHPGGFLVALRDTTDDGRADRIVRFGDSAQSGGAGGTGIAVYRGHVYAEANDKIVRYRLGEELAPSGAAETVVQGLPLTGDHPMHPFAIDSAGGLYVDLGSATNACQIKNRMAGSPGHRPCTELATRGGIWRYDANRTGQRFSPAERYATGIRNADGIAVDSSGKVVYATQHGRDQLFENWPKLYSQPVGAAQPAEELLVVEQGGDYGWPECYFDTTAKKLVLAPEYGGDGGKAVGPCANKRGPLAWYPAHWAPNALALTAGRQFPTGYAGGIFIAFHGSWNRAPAPQEGYNVVFQPMANGKPTGKFEIFADGFAGAVKDPGKAEHRPAGVAFGPDGSLYISDDVRGRIWRVTYRGAAALASRARPESTSAPAVSQGEQAAKPVLPPEGINPNAGESASGTTALPPPPPVPSSAKGVTAAMLAQGDSVFHGMAGGATCVGCHGADAKGTPLGPDLTDNQWLWSNGSLTGIQATIAKGVPAPKQHTGVMPPMGGAQLTQAQLHAVAAYVFALSRSRGK